LCSHDKAVAERGAHLYLEGWAPLLTFAGGLGAVTKHLWSELEADQFARIAVAMGVQPADRRDPVSRCVRAGLGRSEGTG
jgi:hypothetical protein